MAEFVEHEVEESEGEGEGGMDDERIGVVAHQQNKKRSVAVHSDDDEEEEDEDDGQVVNDLIDDNPIEEDESGDESDGSRKRKKSDDEDELSDRLEEDDYDLIEENLGVKVQRRKFKRLRRIVDDDSDGEGPQNQGDDREAIANQLFEGSDNEDDDSGTREPIREETAGQYASEESEGEYSETDDFIVDDEGRPLNDGRRKRKATFTDATLQNAQDIFGVDFDFDVFEKYEDEEDDEEDEEDELEDQEGRTVRREKKESRLKRKTKSIYEFYEPHELERAGLTEKDDKIRKLDIPERMQLRSVPVTAASDEELDEEAEWIYKTGGFVNRGMNAVRNEEVRGFPDSVALPVESEANWDEDWDKRTVVPAPAPTTFGPVADDNWENVEEWARPARPGAAAAAALAEIPRPAGTVVEGNWDEEEWGRPSKTTKDAGADSPAKVAQLEKSLDEIKPLIISKIRNALALMRNMIFEVPFIAFYRKEYVLPELDINDLWKIYRLDARFCSLKDRKSRLVKLFNNMREHQEDFICAHPEDPISDSIRLITDDDIERIKIIQNGDELKDAYLFFTLYYGEQVPAMKHNLKMRRSENRQRARSATATEREGEDAPPPGGEPNTDLRLANKTSSDQGKRDNFKQKMSNGAYDRCKKLGVGAFVNRFGLSAGKFAENLRDKYQRHEVEQCPMDPLAAAQEICSGKLTDPDDVLKGAKLMMATEISREPIVRRCVREVFFERATISCSPTKKGLKEIDEAHACFNMKYLCDKHVRDLTGDQYIKLISAEEDRLLTIRLGDKIKGVTSPSYIEEVKLLFSRDEFSKNVQDWNTLRGECIEHAFEKFLYPDLRKELRAKLAEDAKEYVLNACCEKLRNWLKVAPSKVFFCDEFEDWNASRGIRVLAVAYVPDHQQASFACLVNPDGEPSDYVRLQSIAKNKNSFRDSDREEKESDIAAIKNFIRDKKPHLIVIGGESLEAQMIQQDIKDVVTELMSQDAFPDINVEIVDNQLAKVYANSTRATNDFRDYPLLLRQAISLGRRMQDPLIEYSQLCTADDEILCVRFHPYQDHVPKDELLEHLCQEFINQTNEVGVDINRAISHPYTANLIQFTGGLGNRKATALIKSLKQKNQLLENRSQLVTVHGMGPIILTNCSGFIKIDTDALGDSTETYIEVLDGSRVHPEVYEWAQKMAFDAMDYDADANINGANAIEEILESPEKLNDLDLDALARELERLGLGDKSITVYDIRNELTCRYKDLRTPPIAPSQDDLFYMLVKETKESLYIGRLMTATVVGITRKRPQRDQLDKAVPVKNEITGMWQCPFCGQNDFPELSEGWAHFDAGSCPGQATGVRIRLDNGIGGFIPTLKLSDKQVTNPDERVKRGQTIHCRLLKIDFDRFSLECTSRSSDLLDSKGEWKQTKDPNYDQEREDFDNDKDEATRKTKPRQAYVRRVIVHPSFKNITFAEAEKMMDSMDQGEVIVRPSSKGTNHLTVTWKVADGISQHVDVIEQAKENAFSLGQTLWIGDEEFEDLDEIIARYINPMASHASQLINYKYYNSTLGGSRHRADEYLAVEKAKNPKKIHYILQASKEFPAKFLLSYLPRTIGAHEFVTVTPQGFRFRQRNFESVDELLKWFKEHYRDPPPAFMFLGTPKTHENGTPGYATRAMSHFGSHHPAPTTPHYTTPAQPLTPYLALLARTTPHLSSQTPRLVTNQPHGGNYDGFLRPDPVTPSYKASQHRSGSGGNKGHGTLADGSLGWRQAADAFARSAQQTGGPAWPSQSGNLASSAVARHGGAGNVYGGTSRVPPTSSRNVAQVIHEGIENLSSSAHNYVQSKSPHSGRESLKSTPRTNCSPRSMVESWGDETPTHDES